MSINSRRHLQTGLAGDAVYSGEPIGNSIGADVILIIAVLLSVMICALMLDFIVRLVVRCLYSVSGPRNPPGPINLGRTTDAIRKLPIVIHGSECSICLNQIEPGERVRLLPNCGHCFHVQCVDRWLAVRSSCPTCRQTPFAASLESAECAEPEKAVWKALNRELGL
ncbi:hypothetical protein KFK09_024610 [Dendrobium nobile]|uniref:RING-type domain-containing protein n=1 Tax=Dendrobium nobile TaxID=94219 RepID=A0A8T3AF99_DENNO|nr:hypothetical protein KFK09_024610 [Dendrobium nobile]